MSAGSVHIGKHIGHRHGALVKNGSAGEVDEVVSRHMIDDFGTVAQVGVGLTCGFRVFQHCYRRDLPLVVVDESPNDRKPVESDRANAEVHLTAGSVVRVVHPSVSCPQELLIERVVDGKVDRLQVIVHLGVGEIE